MANSPPDSSGPDPQIKASDDRNIAGVQTDQSPLQPASRMSRFLDAARDLRTSLINLIMLIIKLILEYVLRKK